MALKSQSQEFNESGTEEELCIEIEFTAYVVVPGVPTFVPGELSYDGTFPKKYITCCT